MEIGRDHSRQIASDEEAHRIWEDAVALARQGAWSTALAIFMRLADAGYAGAAYPVASILEAGPGDVSQDWEKAEAWYQRAVTETSDPDARFFLARLILKRRKGGSSLADAQRIDYALRLLNELVDDEDPYAAVYLGNLYLEGQFAAPSLQRAEELFRRAADQGFIVAFIQLSDLAFRGRRPLRALSLRLTALAKAIRLACTDRHDKRLFLVYPGDQPNKDEFPGWYKPGTWLRFD